MKTARAKIQASAAVMLQACEGTMLPKRLSEAIPNLVVVVIVLGVSRKGRSQWNERVCSSVARTRGCSTSTYCIQGVLECSFSFACSRPKVYKHGLRRNECRRIRMQIPMRNKHSQDSTSLYLSYYLLYHFIYGSSCPFPYETNGTDNGATLYRS